MNSYLNIKSFLGQEKAIELLGGCRPLSCKEKVKKIQNWLKNQSIFIHRPEEGVGNDPSFGEGRPSGIYQLQKCPKTSPKYLRRSRKVPRAIREREKEKPIGTDLTHKGTGSPNWNLQLWPVFSIWPELLWNSQPKRRKG
ncbi:hypothetical protein O181_040071 [Austropuccinia psidii MF-1]|uniref:Uncharacterized protein n=1 Tax=Austropuccinia psidii MF-1 TaxID=1389203 RepID=A0A9Q3DAQ7_9BASI|nr:hypothetical protein [Austropuccinia psidii MF-1]